MPFGRWFFKRFTKKRVPAITGLPYAPGVPSLPLLVVFTLYQMKYPHKTYILPKPSRCGKHRSSRSGVLAANKLISQLYF